MKLEKIREAIGLLNSMVYCGERHTELSERIVIDAINQIKFVEEEINRPVYRSVFDHNPYE